MSIRQLLTLEWVGSGSSRKGQNLYTLDNPPAAPGGAGAIYAALQACSAGYIDYLRLCPSLSIGGVLGSSPYGNCGDYGKLQFRSSNDELVDVNIVAPLAAIFTGAGSDRIDLSNVQVAALIAALQAYGASSSGGALLSVVNTTRHRVRR